MINNQQQWIPYLQRYTNGEWRAPIFRDMIIQDVKNLESQHGKVSLLDIGCGGGFDSDAKIQHSIAQAAGQYIGVEPDVDIKLADIFTQTHRCRFEDAIIERDSIDLAFAVMVLEHFENPQIFWDKVHKILKKGGVFWGFTMDARHWFVLASLAMEKFHIKDWYLNRLHGRRGEERYENYDVYYRSNTPQQIQIFTKSFNSATFLNFTKIGQMDYYFPKKMRWMGRIYDRIAIRMGWHGNLIAVRIEK